MFGTLGIELCRAVLRGLHVEEKKKIFLETFLKVSLLLNWL